MAGKGLISGCTEKPDISGRTVKCSAMEVASPFHNLRLEPVHSSTLTYAPSQVALDRQLTANVLGSDRAGLEFAAECP